MPERSNWSTTRGGCRYGSQAFNYKFVPGQVLIAVGETSSGKTLENDTQPYCSGGGQPLKYMTGGTGFNGELARSVVCISMTNSMILDLG